MNITPGKVVWVLGEPFIYNTKLPHRKLTESWLSFLLEQRLLENQRALLLGTVNCQGDPYAKILLSSGKIGLVSTVYVHAINAIETQ